MRNNSPIPEACYESPLPDIDARLDALENAPQSDEVALEIHITKRWLKHRAVHQSILDEPYDANGQLRYLTMELVTVTVTPFSSVSEINEFVAYLHTIVRATNNVLPILDEAERLLLHAKKREQSG